MGIVDMLALAADGTMPIPVRSEGWSPTTYAVSAVGALLVPFLVALLRFWPTMRKLKDSADASLRSDLLEQVKGARKELDEARAKFDGARTSFDLQIQAERRSCDRRLQGMQNKMDAMTRQFVAFQIIVARTLPQGASSQAVAAADRLMEIISMDVTDFEPPEDLDVIVVT